MPCLETIILIITVLCFCIPDRDQLSHSLHRGLSSTSALLEPTTDSLQPITFTLPSPTSTLLKMAWRCSGSTNAELISNMRRSSLITSPRVSVAMTQVDRANYVPSSSRGAYQDSPQPIGYGATISAPHMHAHAAENLLPFLSPGAKVLDVGSGSGYTLAIFHHLVKPGKVVGVEHIQELVDQARVNLDNDGLGEAMTEGRVVNVCGDGRQGLPEEAPFDAIHVGAAAPGIPQALIDQLKAPGRMFIPVAEQDGSGEQNIWQVDKGEDGKVTREKVCGVMYVPLTDREAQWSG